jgi:hypothetical protein
MQAEPEPTTAAQVVHRAVQAVDPDGESTAVTELLARWEDRDEPVTAVADIDSELAETVRTIELEDDDPALSMTAAVAAYLAHRRDELHEDRDVLLLLAARSEFEGRPPSEIEDWLADQGIVV